MDKKKAAPARRKEKVPRAPLLDLRLDETSSGTSGGAGARPPPVSRDSYQGKIEKGLERRGGGTRLIGC